MRKIKRYGWRRDLPHTHKKYQPKRKNIPDSVDLRPQCPAVYDQGQLGSCTANGIAGCIEFARPGVMPSRLFIYYNERAMEGDIDQDGGAQIHDGIKSVVTQGYCPETQWPYNISKFTNKPSQACYSEALGNLIKDYNSVNLADIKPCLADGFPVVFGMTVYESFESEEVAETGVVPMPKAGEEVVGGHCMEIVGYTNNDYFIVRNSWATTWAMAGYCLIPCEYITQYASDFWQIEA